MIDKYTYPGNLISSSIADRESKLLRLLSTIHYAIYAFGNIKKLNQEYINDSIRINALAEIVMNGRNREDSEQISRHFLENAFDKIGKLPRSMIDCITLDTADLLNLPVCTSMDIDKSFSPRHSHRVEAARLLDDFSSKYQNYKLRERISQCLDKPRLIITPLAQISIGHLFYLPLALACLSEPEYSSHPPYVTVFATGSGYGKDFYYRIFKSFSEKFLLHSQMSYGLKTTSMHHAWQAEAWALTIGPKRLGEIENKLHKTIALKYPKHGSDVIFHIRTAHWKSDGSRNKYRDCDINIYIELIKRLEPSENIVVITGDRLAGDEFRKHNINVHLVNDIESSYAQWDLLERAKFIVGCASGISHLDSITNAPILYLNVMTQIIHLPIKRHHMFSFRKVKALKQDIGSSVVNRLNLFYGLLSGYDGGETSFSDLFEVTHLNSLEMLDEYNDAKELFKENLSEYRFTNRKLAQELGIAYNGPVRNLTKKSYLHLKTILQELPC